MKAHFNYWFPVIDRPILRDWLKATWEVWRVPIGYFAAAFLGGLFVWGVAR